MQTNLSVTDSSKIIKQLEKYNILSQFESTQQLFKWILQLNDTQIQNFLSLNTDPKKIKFDSKLLIDDNLLNTRDYLKRVDTFVSIHNAEGWYHLFQNLVNPELLNSEKFYQDLEMLKKAECAQTPLWIIGNPSFINSPYHDEDFKLLVTAKDTSDKKFDYVVWDAIATIAMNEESIRSGYHRQDLQTVLKYGAPALQSSYSYPQSSINCLAVNPVSLKDPYHLENMELLAQNQEIGNFLYAVMTDKKAVKKNNYRRIIQEMVDYKDNGTYAFLVCYYAVGEEKAKIAQNLVLNQDYLYEIKKSFNISKLMTAIDEKINTVEADFREMDTCSFELSDRILDKKESFIKRLIKKINI